MYPKTNLKTIVIHSAILFGGLFVIENKDVWAYEKAYLERVISEIKDQLDIGINAADNYKRESIKLQKSMWEDIRIAPSSLFDLEDAAQINQIQMDLRNQASLYRFSSEKVNHLKRMIQSPYFGRIDFLENGETESESIYIGIHSLSTNEFMDILVYDWRAPICSMFYDFEIGPSHYSCPAGLIEGDMRLKRQYKIENSAIVYMFDSSLNINDAMLQDLLGKSTDNRMKTIVTSIQKEQNTVIRNSRDKILIVQGPAGSGKTSIALHRAAYVLYRFRDTMKSENILIFSPNHVFEDYISHVLPELGEENIRRSTFADFFENILSTGLKKETMSQQMEYLLNADQSNDIRLECIRFKSSPVFLDILKKYVQHLESGAALNLKDIVYHNKLMIAANDILLLYKNQDSRLPYANRLGKIRERLFKLLEEYEDKRGKDAFEMDPHVKDISPADKRELEEEYELMKEEIIRMTAFETIPLYVNLFENFGKFPQTFGVSHGYDYRIIADYTDRTFREGMIYYEDFAPLIYLRTALERENRAASVKHVVIDEAQDYTSLQYEIFKTVFKNSNMTILGDVNQTVNGYMNIGNFDAITNIFDVSTRKITLTKSYRSSKELADFCKELLTTPMQSEQLNRHGDKPKVIKAHSSGLYKRMAEDIIDLKNKGYKLIAVICKTAAKCRAVHQSLSSLLDICLISNHNEVYYGDVVVIPSYLAKGLEFDAVLIDSIEDMDYRLPEDRKLLYTVCTRALHQLYLYYAGTPSRFVSSIDRRLYIFDDATQ